MNMYEIRLVILLSTHLRSFIICNGDAEDGEFRFLDCI